MNRIKSLVLSVVVASCIGPFGSAERSALSQESKEKSTSVKPVSLCHAAEPGEKLSFSGCVIDYQGKPLAMAAVVAYNADRNGLYVPTGSTTRIPRIRGVCVTDS